MELTKSTVIVTGAGSGIGRVLALEFARNGANVVCCGRRKELLDETAALICQEDGVGLAVPADITDRDQVRHLVDTAVASFGTVDILFNNAGSFRSIAALHETDPEVWWQDITVNLYGSMLVTREVLPHMLQRNRGIIISMDGGRPAGGTGYACGKAALMEMTRLLAKELKILKSSVMVFSAGPGFVHTEMTELQANTEAGRKWIPSTKESIEAGKTRRPEDIALATMQLVRHARPEWSGKGYSSDTDFSRKGVNPLLLTS